MKTNLFPVRQCVLATVTVLACSSALAQYSGPESVEYDPVGDRYFISNTTSRIIKVRDQAGTVTDFTAVLANAPYGLEIMGDVLYACAGNGVLGFSLATGAQVYQRNLGASFPNGITTDGEFLYITDFSSNPRRVLKVDPVNDSHTTLVANAGGQPNGIVWDAIGDRLVTVFWGSNAPIRAFDRNTGAATVLVANTGVGNVDGVTIDCDGNFLIASWSPARITRFEPTFTQAGVNANVPGLNNPADMDFDATNLRVCIPNAGNNTVTLFDVSSTCLSTGAADALADREPLHAVPNPTGDRLRISPALSTSEPYILLDARGLLVGGGTLRAGSELDLGALPTGVYVIHLTQLNQRIRVVKE
jgi:hypothetical protein